MFVTVLTIFHYYIYPKFCVCLVLFGSPSGVDCSPPSCKPLWENQNSWASNKLWVLISTSPFHTYHRSQMKRLGSFESNHNLVYNKFLKCSIVFFSFFLFLLKYELSCFKHPHSKSALLRVSKLNKPHRRLLEGIQSVNKYNKYINIDI